MAKFAMFLTNANFFALLVSLGLDQALAREFHETRSPRELLKKVLQLVFLAIPVGVLGLGIVKANTNGLPSDSITGLMVTACVLMLLNRIYSSFIRMSGKGVAYSIDIVTPKVLQLSLIALIGSQSMLVLTYEVIVAIFVGSTGFALCYEIFMAARIGRRLEASVEGRGRNDPPRHADLLKFSVPLVPGALAYYAISASAIYIVGANGNSREVVTTSLAISVGGGLAVLQSVFATLWAPFAYRWHARNYSPALYGHIATLVTMGCSILLLASMFFVPFLSLLFPEKYDGLSRLVILVIVWNLMYLISIVGSFGIGVMRMSLTSMTVSIIGAVLSIGMSFIANRYLGAHGALLAVLGAFNVTLILNCELSTRGWRRVIAFPHYAMVGVMTISGVMFSLGYEWQAKLVLAIFIIFYLRSFRFGLTHAHALLKKSGV